MNDAQKKALLESDLSALNTNFYERDTPPGKSVKTFSPPTLAEVENNYAQDSKLRENISELLDGSDAIKRLYAAVLVSEVDWEKARDVLEKLSDNATQVKVQARLGFSVVETTIAIPARDFLNERQIRGTNFTKEENLNRWAAAISKERHQSKREFDAGFLPKWKDVLDARENAGQMERLRAEIDRLKNGDGAAEKFYAAALLGAIDESESKKVLESLLTEKTEVLVGYGDLKHNMPANQVAESMLNLPTSFQTSAPANPIARATKWLEKNFFDKKSGK